MPYTSPISGDKKPRSPKKKLTLASSLVAALILLSPLASAEAGVTRAFGSESSADSLLIDSDTLDLNALPITDEGFIMKRGTASADTDRSTLRDVFDYEVSSGDTIISIARKFGITPETLMSENAGLSAKNLQIGSKLRILPVNGVSYVTKDGDTLDSIAKEFGVESDAIARQNGLAGSVPTDITLVIPGGVRKSAAPASRSGATLQKPTAGRSSSRGSIPKASDDDGGNQGGKWMIKPTEGLYTTYFSRAHYAVDIANRSSPAIMAAAKGTISRAQCGWNGGYGCMIVIDHGNGMQTLYAHLSKIDVEVGDSVGQGDEIAVMGHTGRVYGATGIHLHFEVIDHGKKKNPLLYY